MSLLRFFSDKTKSTCFMGVSFHYHMATSGSLVIYNHGSRTLNQVRVFLLNSNHRHFEYSFEEISGKTGVLLPYSLLDDRHGNVFEGEIEMIKILHDATYCAFKRDGDRFRDIGSF